MIFYLRIKKIGVFVAKWREGEEGKKEKKQRFKINIEEAKLKGNCKTKRSQGIIWY